MLRAVVISCLLVCCYCSVDNELFVEETRAKKQKSPVKLWGVILLALFIKLAISKVFSIFMLSMFFQKLFTIGGVFLKYFLSNRPSMMYGPPEYNTVGYSYGPPEANAGSNMENGLGWLFKREN